MKGMKFLPDLAKFLRENGCIYTVRRYRYSLGDTPVSIEGVGPCDRVHIRQVSRKEDLTDYVQLSGFQTADDWWHKIREFNRGYVGLLYLYEITTLEDLG